MARFNRLTEKQEEQLKVALYQAVAEQIQKEMTKRADDFNNGGYKTHQEAMKTVLEQMRTAVATDDERAIARNSGKFNFIGAWPQETYDLLMMEKPDGVENFDTNYDYLKFLSNREEFAPLKKMPLLIRDPKTL